jgi:hypothetical protein
LLFVTSVFRLLPLALEPIQAGMGPLEWAAGIANIFFMAYTEGYKAFQLAFSPRVVARGWHLLRNPRLVHVAFAPLFCMALFHASKKRLIVAWAILIGVGFLVILVRQLDQPWRGIVDMGVVVGLSWGAVAILVFAVRAIRGHQPSMDPGLPEGHASSHG